MKALIRLKETFNNQTKIKQMKVFNIAIVFALIVFMACNNNKKETASQPFCSDTSCVTDPIRVDSKTTGNPFITISFKDCKIDSIHWEKGGMGIIRDIVFNEFIDKPIKPSKQFINCQIIDGKTAWLKFNDCATGRGYLLALPFNKEGTIRKILSAINNFDPKFKVEEGLIAYYDNTFIYVEDMTTGKVAKQLLTDTGVMGIDYDNVHSLIDSVNITKDNIYAKLLVEGAEKVHNNPLTFK